VKQPLDYPALPLMEAAAQTYKDRRGVYGPSEQKFADVMQALFPNGLTISTHEEMVRLGIFSQILSKICRYANDFTTGHVDSAHDLGVYAFMLEAEDRR
jgi:hypothetical protein